MSNDGLDVSAGVAITASVEIEKVTDMIEKVHQNKSKVPTGRGFGFHATHIATLLVSAIAFLFALERLIRIVY